MTRWPIVWGCLLLISCSTRGRDVLVTQNAVDEFHQFLRAQQDQQIFNTAASEFRASMNFETTQAFLGRVRKKTWSASILTANAHSNESHAERDVNRRSLPGTI
jgi:hypothetical protein